MTFGLTVLGLLLVPCADTITVQQVPSQQGLVNPGFEATLPLDGWEIITYGASADVAIDTKEVLDGRQALRVTAIQGSDTALGQEVNVQPGSWYRFTGWIKTRGLQPLDASVIGTFQIQRSRGRGTNLQVGRITWVIQTGQALSWFSRLLLMVEFGLPRFLPDMARDRAQPGLMV